MGRIVLMKNNVEDELEYVATYEKPFKAYNKTLEWREHKLPVGKYVRSAA